MSERTDKNISCLRLYENEHFPSIKTMSILHILPCTLILSYLYLSISEALQLVGVDNKINSNTADIVVSGILLILYVAMLFGLSKGIKRIKENKKIEFNLRSEEVSAVFLLVLLLDSICLIYMSWFYKNERYLVMSIISLTLYVGFTVSLDKLFDGNKEGTICYQLIKPFKDMGLDFKQKWKTILLILACSLTYTRKPYIVLLITVFVSIAFVIIMMAAKKRIKVFSENIIKEFSSKRVLLLQLGPSNAMIKTANEMFAEYCATNYESIADLNKETFDAIVVLNTARNQGEHIVKTDLNNVFLSKEGVIIDPFRWKSEIVSFWAAWFCFPSFSKRWSTIEEYIDVFK